jgi:arylsulfatase
MYRDARYKLVVYHGSDEGELFDLVEDPDEFVNLWREPSARELRHALLASSFDASIIISDPGPRRIGRY